MCQSPCWSSWSQGEACRSLSYLLCRCNVAGRLSGWLPCLRLWRTWTMQAKSCAACSPSPGTGRGSGKLQLLVPHGMEAMSCASNNSASHTLEPWCCLFSVPWCRKRLRWGSPGGVCCLAKPCCKEPHQHERGMCNNSCLAQRGRGLTCSGLKTCGVYAQLQARLHTP